ncbi:MAG: hypothetical protein WCJ58_00470 [bacterium]
MFAELARAQIEGDYRRQALLTTPDGRQYSAHTLTPNRFANAQEFDDFMQLLATAYGQRDPNRVKQWATNQGQAVNLLTLLYDDNQKLVSVGAAWLPVHDPLVQSEIQETHNVVCLHSAATALDMRGKGLAEMVLCELLDTLSDPDFFKQFKDDVNLNSLYKRYIQGASALAWADIANFGHLTNILTSNNLKIISPETVLLHPQNTNCINLEESRIRVETAAELATFAEQPFWEKWRHEFHFPNSDATQLATLFSDIAAINDPEEILRRLKEDYKIIRPDSQHTQLPTDIASVSEFIEGMKAKQAEALSQLQQLQATATEPTVLVIPAKPICTVVMEKAIV